MKFLIIYLVFILILITIAFVNAVPTENCTTRTFETADGVVIYKKCCDDNGENCTHERINKK